MGKCLRTRPSASLDLGEEAGVLHAADVGAGMRPMRGSDARFAPEVKRGLVVHELAHLVNLRWWHDLDSADLVQVIGAQPVVSAMARGDSKCLMPHIRMCSLEPIVLLLRKAVQRLR